MGKTHQVIGKEMRSSAEEHDDIDGLTEKVDRAKWPKSLPKEVLKELC